MYICISVCISVCIPVCIYLYVYIMYVYLYVHLYIYLYVYLYMYISVCIIYVCISVLVNRNGLNTLKLLFIGIVIAIYMLSYISIRLSVYLGNGSIVCTYSVDFQHVYYIMTSNVNSDV